MENTCSSILHEHLDQDEPEWTLKCSGLRELLWSSISITQQ
jgi:hypothetical protein